MSCKIKLTMKTEENLQFNEICLDENFLPNYANKRYCLEL